MSADHDARESEFRRLLTALAETDPPCLSSEAEADEELRLEEAVAQRDVETLRELVASRQARERRARILLPVTVGLFVVVILLAVAIVAMTQVGR